MEAGEPERVSEASEPERVSEAGEPERVLLEPTGGVASPLGRAALEQLEP